ncbi:MAG: hypothetical protein AAGG44_19820 [Planctomycetota bacterium]
MMCSKRELSAGRQISLVGIVGYSTLWAVMIALFKAAVNLQQGTHTIGEARLSQIMMLAATGLLFVAIGLPISLLTGKTRERAQFFIVCFLLGLAAIPVLISVLGTLASFDLLDLD